MQAGRHPLLPKHLLCRRPRGSSLPWHAAPGRGDTSSSPTPCSARLARATQTLLLHLPPPPLSPSSSFFTPFCPKTAGNTTSG